MLQNRNSPYWDWLAQSAPSATKQEYYKSEKTKSNSFTSIKTLLTRRTNKTYGS